MSTKTRLETDMREALRHGDDRRKSTLRMALASIKLLEIDKGAPLDEGEALAVLHKEVKSRRESIADAERAGRLELAAESQSEIAILESYLPKPFTEAELEELARQVIAEVGASSSREMGVVMKVLVSRLEGRATGSQASQVVRKLLG
ncbi:MAG TPA: GatB/YqeY domain-containing protein [Anaerolineales bacterium]|nr:GatB/YqeY domain-containing protein [Anaerolineales bacterium]